MKNTHYIALASKSLSTLGALLSAVLANVQAGRRAQPEKYSEPENHEATSPDGTFAPEIIETANRAWQDEQKVATSVAVISGKGSQQQGVSTLSDALKGVSGTWVTGAGPESNIRGIGPSSRKRYGGTATIKF